MWLMSSFCSCCRFSGRCVALSCILKKCASSTKLTIVRAGDAVLLFFFGRYDAFSSILGEGKPFVGIDNSYLQSGHTVLLALVLVCAFIDLPGFPLTSLPYDVREFLKVFLTRAPLHVRKK